MDTHTPKTNASVAKTTRFLYLGIAFLCLFLILSDHAFARTRHRRAVYTPPPYSSVIMDAQTGKILDSTSADARRYPASLTKLMTLFLTFEAMDRGHLHANDALHVSSNATRQPPSKLGLRVGQSISAQQAILVLVTRSANDVAVALAETIGGSTRNFARMMNERAASLGMKGTHFANPSGLPDPNQYTTARDIALLSRSLMQYFPHYYHYFGVRQCNFRGEEINTHNNLMCRYPGMDGLKTGYINTSGFNLAASAVRNNRRVIVVVFGGRTANSRDRHVADLLDKGFEMLQNQPASPMVAETSPAAPTASETRHASAETHSPATTSPETPSQATSIVSSALEDATPAPVQTASAATADRPGTQRIAYLPTDTRRQGNWGIQVGAYGSETLGQQALRMARSILDKHLPSSAQGIVMPVQTPQGLIYRARFVGLSATHASQACQRLRECMVFAMQ